MNIEHLRLFVQIARTQSISQAGKALSLSPAVASTYIGKLEAGLKVRLIHRTTRKVALTEEGIAFLPHAEAVLASIEAAHAAVAPVKSVPSGTLRLTAPASFGRMHLMPAMNGFMQRYPDLKLDCHFTDNIVDLVEGGFDIAIRNAPLKSSSLVARKLAHDRRIVCASPAYLQTHGTPQVPQDLQQHDCITLAGLEHWPFETPEGRVVIKVNGRFRADNGEAVRDACLQGLGITVCSTWIAYQYLQKGELVVVLDACTLASGSALWAVYPSSRQLAPKVRAFIDYFIPLFGPEPYWDCLHTCAGPTAD